MLSVDTNSLIHLPTRSSNNCDLEFDNTDKLRENYSIGLLAGYPASLGPLLPCMPPSHFLPPCPLSPVRPSLSPSSGGGFKNLSIFWAVHDISRTLDFFDALKSHSHISTRICVPNLVAVRRSCRKKGRYRQTDRQADRQTDKGKLQLYIVD